MALGNPGSLGTGFGKLGLQPVAGTSTPGPPPSGAPSLNFSTTTASMYVPLLAGFA